MEGWRDKTNGLWRTTLAKQNQVNTMQKTTTICEQMQFLHEAAGSPVTSTWTTAVKNGYFISWPGLTVENINKHLPKSVATTRGHMEMQHKGATYANTNLPIQEEEDVTQAPTQEPNNAKTHMIFGAVLDEGRIYTDQTGRFPHHSSKGTKYVMVLYCYDANAILTEPLKNRTEAELSRAYKKLYEYLKAKG